jgi:hypothetical protein
MSNTVSTIEVSMHQKNCSPCRHRRSTWWPASCPPLSARRPAPPSATAQGAQWARRGTCRCCTGSAGSRYRRRARPTGRVGNKKPNKKKHLKKPTKNFFSGFLGFLNFLFFMKVIQTFLFETDFL